MFHCRAIRGTFYSAVDLEIKLRTYDVPQNLEAMRRKGRYMRAAEEITDQAQAAVTRPLDCQAVSDRGGATHPFPLYSPAASAAPVYGLCSNTC